MNIRLLEAAESSDAENLLREVFLDQNGYGMTEEAGRRYLEEMKDRLASCRLLGALEGDLVGVLAYEPETFLIRELAVRREKRGKGTATQLLKTLTAEAQAQGAARLQVLVRRPALPLFRGFGFESEGEPVDTDGIRYVHMEYLLGRDWLGRKVHVEVELPYGSYHPLYPDEICTCNKGILTESPADSAGLQAYVFGIHEPRDTFAGTVIAVIYNRHGDTFRLVVSDGSPYRRQDVIDAVAFEEQYEDVRIFWDRQEKQA